MERAFYHPRGVVKEYVVAAGRGNAFGDGGACLICENRVMQAHVPTLFLVMMVVSLTLAILLGVGARRGDGLAHWSVAMAMHVAAYYLFSLRDRISDAISIVLANLMLSAVFALMAEGLCQFQRRAPPRAVLWMPTAAVAHASQARNTASAASSVPTPVAIAASR